MYGKKSRKACCRRAIRKLEEILKGHKTAQKLKVVFFGQGTRNGTENGKLAFMATAQLNRILMVEDDTDIQTVARLSLEAVGGYAVEICSGGHEALERVKDFKPDLVLLDVMMPDMDGPTVLQHLRNEPQTKELPVVFMTAKAQAHEVAAYKAMGALEVVSKPFDPMLLSSTLAQIWQQQFEDAPSVGGAST